MLSNDLAKQSNQESCGRQETPRPVAAMACHSHGLSQPRAPGAFPATARVRGGSALGRALGLCPRFHSRAMAPGDGRSVWKPWQSGDKVQRGEGSVMAGSVLGFSPRQTAGPHGTQGAGRVGVPAQPCREGRRQPVWELPGQQRTSGAMETAAGGMQGPCCQIHSFVGDCLQSDGLICCLSVVISSFLKCFR